MKNFLDNWPRLTFFVLPLLIILVDAAVIYSERSQPESEKAIRLVRESRSRKENFTVQQYLYMTIYYRKAGGEAIEIEGWRAWPSPEGNDTFDVEFIFTEKAARQVARWKVSVSARDIIPLNDTATSLSWR